MWISTDRSGWCHQVVGCLQGHPCPIHKMPTITDMEAEVERLESELEEAREKLEQAREEGE